MSGGRLVELTRACAQAIDFEEAEATLLPALRSALGCISASVYHLNALDDLAEHTAGPRGLLEGVVTIDDNPIRDLVFARNPRRRWRADELLPRARLERTAVYRELLEPYDADWPLLMPLAGERWDSVGFCGLILTRPAGRGGFSDADLALLDGLTPALAALGRRHQRARLGRDAWQRLLELEPDGAHAALALDGSLLACSRAVERVLRPRPALGDAREQLAAAARELARLLRGGDGLPRVTHTLSVAGEPLQAELSVATSPSTGEPFILATLLGEPLVRAALEPAVRAFGLSPAEAAVCAELQKGKSNVDIGAALFISPATVRTHLYRIFAKLGVSSRLKAVLKLRRPS